MLTGKIAYSSLTRRLAVHTLMDNRIMSFDIPNQELASIYTGSLVNFDINEMDDAVCISIISL